MIEIVTAYHAITNNIFPNIITFTSVLATGTYFKGAIENRMMRRRKRAGQFDELATQSTTAHNIYCCVNKALDGAYKAVARITYKSLFSCIDSLIPDRSISRALDRIYSKQEGLISGRFEERVKRAKLDFDKHEDAFMFHAERSIDNRQVSNIISGRYFNGKPVADYLPMFISEKTFSGSLKAGVVAFLISFGILSLAYKPQWTFGYLSQRALTQVVNQTVQSIQANPATYSKDQTQAFAVASELAEQSTGYDFNIILRLFTNGIFTSLVLAIGIGMAFHRRVLNRAMKSINIPFVADSVEEYLYPSRSYAIKSYKFALAGSNMRTAGWDAGSPLISIMSSTGVFEAKGVIGAYRQGQPIYQSTLDLSQNMLVLGGTGEGKSRQIIMPFVAEVLRIKSQHLDTEKDFQEYMNLRTGHITAKVNLSRYEPLPEPRIAVSMTIMDAKSALWKDVKKVASKFYLESEFKIVGANNQAGELAVDLLSNLEPSKFIAILMSMSSQFGGEVSNDFWEGFSLNMIRQCYDICYLFARTIEGADYLEQYSVKPTSLLFLYKLAVTDNDNGNNLLAHCIYSIHKCMSETPERLADVLTEERLDSIEYMMDGWNKIPDETKGGFMVNMRKLLTGLNDDKLTPFLSGVSEHNIEVGEFWQNIVGFNISMAEYGIPGKFIQLMLKTLIMEEAAARQQRFSQRVEDLGSYFLHNFPNVSRTEAAIETMRLDVVTEENQEILEQFKDKCATLQESTQKTWKRGTYKQHLLEISDTQPPSADVEHSSYSADDIVLAKEALALDRQFRLNQPRITESSVNLSDLDPSTFEAKAGDNEATLRHKREAMANFYEYVENRNRIDREHMFFIGDEYQEFITIDKTGAAFSDLNFWNQSRSTNTKGMIATQTLNAFDTRVEREVRNNFKDQFRTQIILVTDDQDTIEHVTNSAGEVSFNKNALQSQHLKIDGMPTEYELYNSFNSVMSKRAMVNKNRVKDGINDKKGYLLTFDPFAEPEPMDVDVGALTVSTPFSSAGEDIEDIHVPSFKDHFVNHTELPQYQRTGSSNTETRDNLDDIRSKHKAAQDAKEADYNKYMNDNIVVNAKVYDSSDYKAAGNLQAFAIIKRGNISRVDQVNIAIESDYMDRNN